MKIFDLQHDDDCDRDQLLAHLIKIVVNSNKEEK
jgi:hypothetical protein